MRRTIACRDGSVETVLSCAHPGDAVRTERAFREWGACVSFLSLYAPVSCVGSASRGLGAGTVRCLWWRLGTLCDFGATLPFPHFFVVCGVMHPIPIDSDFKVSNS